MMISRRTFPLVAIFTALVLLPGAVRAQPSGTPQDANEAVLVGMTIIEVPAQVSQKYGLAERLADLGLVLSDAEAKKLTEAGQNAPGCNVVQVPSVRTAIGRSTVMDGSMCGRRIACLVLPESSASNGEITLRIAPLPAARSPAEIAAGDHAALFALTRTSATVRLHKNESMMLGGWKTGKDNSRTLVVIVKPQLAADPLATLARHSQSSTMSMMSMVDPRMVIQEEEEERLGVVREVPTAQKPAAAAASARPSAPGPLPRSATPGEKESRQVLVAIKLVEIDEGKMVRLGFDFQTLSPPGVVPQRAGEGRLPGMAMLCGADTMSEVVEALHKAGLARVLAEPTLVTVSGRPACFRVGGEIPLWSLGPDGQPVARPEPYGTSVDLVPRLTDDGNVRLEVRCEHSEVDRTKTTAIAEGKENPAFRRSCFATAWEAKPGQTLAVAQRSLPASPDGKDSPGRAILMLITPRVVDATAALPSPDKAKTRVADAAR